ncbi:hypothetical protein FACS1894133_6090 [Clostridia bacterium]|nr:hypothetical protein FACS1894133_6090 [Clostridia bacterium]
MNSNIKKIIAALVSVSVISAAAVAVPVSAAAEVGAIGAEATNAVEGTPAVTAQRVASGKILVSWTPVANASGYVLYTAYEGESQYKTHGSTTNTECVLSGFKDGVAAHFIIRSYRHLADGTYEYGAVSNVATAIAGTTAVQNLKATPTASDKVTVNWDAAPNATSYNVYIAGKTDTAWTKIGTITGTTFYSANLAANSLYAYYVTPMFKGAEGSPCASVTATTYAKGATAQPGSSLRGVFGTWYANNFNVNGATKITLNADGTSIVNGAAAGRYYSYVLDNGDREISVAINGTRVVLRYKASANKLYYGNAALVK